MSNIIKKHGLLVISPQYNYFVKNQVDILSGYFDHVYVLVRHNPIAEVSNFFPIDSLKRYRRNTLIDLTNKPENLTIIPTPLFYAPTDRWYEKLGDQHFKVVNRIISKNKINFDLIHSHFTWTSGYVGTKLKEEYNVPFILTIHENRDWFVKEYQSRSRKIHDTWRSADAIVRVNKIDIPILKKFNDNVYYITNGFSPVRFFPIDKTEAKRELGILDDKRIVFSLGILIKRKGFQYLVEAMKNVIKKRRDTICIIGGHGKLKKYLERKINNLSLQDYIRLIGFVPNNKLNLWMNAADFFILPSLSEGTPTAMFEALGCGKPFIGTNVGGTPEIITSEDYGLLCEPANPKDLAEKILMGLDKEWDCNKLIKYARQFTWDNIVKQLLEVYEKVLI